MQKKILLIAFLFAVLFGAAAILMNNQKEEQSQVCFQNFCFNVELAKTVGEITRGLMFRESLGANTGMLFIFEKEGAYPFWMKNTFIPLDIIWINSEKEVVFVSENTRPCKDEYFCLSINPGKNAKYVLEINGGIAEKVGLKIGDKMSF